MRKKVCELKNRVLKPRGKPERDDFPRLNGRKPKRTERHSVTFVFLAEKRQKYQKSGYVLRNYARDSDARNVDTNHDHEEKIENYVDYTRRNQIHERTACVAYRRENSVAAVVRRERGHSEKINAQI